MSKVSNWLSSQRVVRSGGTAERRRRRASLEEAQLGSILLSVLPVFHARTFAWPSGSVARRVRCVPKVLDDHLLPELKPADGAGSADDTPGHRAALGTVFPVRGVALCEVLVARALDAHGGF